MVGVRVTAGVARVCALILTEPDRRWYGLEIGRRLQLGSGVVYPLLDRLVQAGVLAAENEQRIGKQSTPPRRWLWLTPEGKIWAQRIVDAMRGELGPAAIPAPEPAPAAGTVHHRPGPDHGRGRKHRRRGPDPRPPAGDRH